MMSLTFGLFTQVSGSGPLGPLVLLELLPILTYTLSLPFLQCSEDGACNLRF